MSQIVETTFKYNGAEFYFDIEDAECAETYEVAIRQFERDYKTLQKDGGNAKFIREYCNIFENLFDGIFGPGAGKKILGEKQNSRAATEAYSAFIDFVQAQTDAGLELKNSFANRYTNRQQRRAAERAARKAEKRAATGPEE